MENACTRIQPAHGPWDAEAASVKVSDLRKRAQLKRPTQQTASRACSVPFGHSPHLPVRGLVSWHFWRRAAQERPGPSSPGGGASTSQRTVADACAHQATFAGTVAYTAG